MRLAGTARAPSLTFAHAVPGGERSPVRVLLARMEMHRVAREVAAAGLGEVATVTLWDAAGRILLRQPDPDGFLGRLAPESEVGRAILTVRGEGTIEAASDSRTPALRACERSDAAAGDLPDAGWQDNPVRRRAGAGLRNEHTVTRLVQRFSNPPSAMKAGRRAPTAGRSRKYGNMGA
jgi:hypothetical protein